MSTSIKGRVKGGSNYNDLTVTTDGTSTALDVNIVGGTAGGGSTSDTTAANQASQIAEAQSTNTKLDTLIASQSANTSDSTEAKQDAQITEAQATNTKLDTIIANTAAASSVGSATEGKQDVGNATLDTIRDAETVNVDWDYYDIAYVAAGNGIGEIESVTYFTGTAPGGTQVLLISFTYDANSNITRVERTP